jgi:hypothetical protein
MSWSLIGGGLTIGLACSLAFAGLIPGGGPTNSDCYLELDVQGIENNTQRVENNKVVLCTDGEECDSGPCGDAICNMKIAACINQSDPNLPDCTPPTGLDKAKIPGAFSIEIPQVLEDSACGAFVDVEVKVKRNGKFGKRKIRGNGKGVQGTRPRKDVDNWTLRCYPRTVACPASPSGAFLD